MSSQPTKSVFITGGSGYIGSTLIPLAIYSGYTVHALSRTPTSDAKLISLGAIPVRGDLSSHSILTSSASSADIVFSLADSISDNYGTFSMETRIATNNGGVTALAAGLRGTGKPLIVTSGSLAAAPDPEGRETDETAPPFTEFSPLVIEAEKHAFGLAEEYGIRVCAIRLAPYVYGRMGSGVKIFMGLAMKSGEMFYVGHGQVRVSTVHVEDAARLYLKIAEKGRSGEAYNATAETDVSQRELAEAIGRVVGLKTVSKSFEEAEKQLGWFFAKFLSVGNRASSRKAREELGWEPEVKRGILEEVEKGSYVQLAEELKKVV
ncbi:oxidoreductase domain-containing protein [Clohesyomyces aquaticus]|uniref:Oxidoreductase domain-containing protein n=1 Tax=Clohesyomyces aquaticus TaxID=1231657 RepID=A0A1Y1Y5B4_9PLEO|nr:oxidoreductase domain-containing protein [Clohesyomyces aquaticus]